MTTKYLDKDPSARLTYSVDWTEWLANSETVTTSTFSTSTVAGDTANITIHANSIVSGNLTYADISGGSAGNTYIITNSITTSDGQIDSRRFRLRVTPRYL